MGITREYVRRLDALEEAKDAYAEREADFTTSNSNVKPTDALKHQARNDLSGLLDVVEKKLKEADHYYNALSPSSKIAHASVQEWQETFLSDNRKVVASI